MKRLEIVRADLTSGSFDVSHHALRRMVERDISVTEIAQAGAGAEIVEAYPDDKYAPSALLLGFTSSGRPLHFQVSLTEAARTKIITIYEPDPGLWADFRTRRSPYV